MPERERGRDTERRQRERKNKNREKRKKTRDIEMVWVRLETSRKIEILEKRIGRRKREMER